MKKKDIHITIGPNGDVEKMEMDGFDGDECLEVSKPFEDALGGKILKRERTTKNTRDVSHGETDSESERDKELL